MIYPWQTEQWNRLQQARQAGRLPHALLFKGSAGTGKLYFAEQFMQSLLCTDNLPDGSACNKCHRCLLVLGKADANVFCIVPEKEGHAIKIDQIREVSEFVSQSSLQPGLRIVMIHPAHAMNTNAANALLKTLEEPSSNALLILVTDQSGRLPATILSRCQSVHFADPDHDEAIAWLKQQEIESDMDPDLLLRLVDGAPLNVLRLLSSGALAVRQALFEGLGNNKMDPLKLSAAMQSHEPIQVVDFYISWLLDVLRLGAGVTDIVNIDFKNALLQSQKKMDSVKVVQLLNHAQQTRKLISQGINLNKQLLLEDLLVRWMGYVTISG